MKEGLSRKKRLLGSTLRPLLSSSAIADWFGIVAVLAAEKRSSTCHESYQTALCVIPMKIPRHGSPEFIRVIGVIRGLFIAYFDLQTAFRDSRSLSGPRAIILYPIPMGLNRGLRGYRGYDGTHYVAEAFSNSGNMARSFSTLGSATHAM